MDRTVWNGRGAHSARLLALLAVLFAMHGLASSHHGPASAAKHRAAATPPPDSAEAVRGQGSVSVSAAQQATADVVVPARSHSVEDCPGALLTLRIAVLATPRPWASPSSRCTAAQAFVAPSDHVTCAPTSARTWLPPPDPLRELCISRS